MVLHSSWQQKNGAFLDSVIKYINLGQNYLTSSKQKWSKFGSKWANLKNLYFWKTSQKATLPPPPTQSIVFFSVVSWCPRTCCKLRCCLLFPAWWKKWMEWRYHSPPGRHGWSATLEIKLQSYVRENSVLQTEMPKQQVFDRILWSHNNSMNMWLHFGKKYAVWRWGMEDLYSS